MSEFIAIIYYDDSFDKDPDIEHIEAPCVNDAWLKLIKDKWGDYDPRLGGLENPHTAVKNGDWNPVEDVRMFHVISEDETFANGKSYFNDWYDSACRSYDRMIAGRTEDTERAEYERLRQKFDT